MTTTRQATRRMNQIMKNEGWLDDATLFAEYSELQKIIKLHPSKMTEEQLRAELADGNLSEVVVWGPRFIHDQSELRADSTANYLIYRLRGGVEMHRVSDATGTYQSFGV